MITSLTVMTPREVMDRSPYDADQLASFERVTGILKTRRFQYGTAEMIRRAVELARPTLSLDGIGAVIVVTQSPERLSPCMAMSVHRQLGLSHNVMAFDVNQSCDGFIYGCWIGSTVAVTSLHSLVICADRLRFEGNTPVESLIFSDAVAVAQVTEGYPTGCFHSDGAGEGYLNSSLDGKMHMDGGATFDFVTRNISAFAKNFCENHGGSDYLCQHQSNLSMMNIVEKRIGMNRFPGGSLNSLQEYGNQSMVGIPTALALNENKILGKAVTMLGYGAGWSAAIMKTRWSEKRISKIYEVE